MRWTTSASGNCMKASATVHASSTCSSDDGQLSDGLLPYRGLIEAWAITSISSDRTTLVTASTAHLEDHERGQAPHLDASIRAHRTLPTRVAES